MVDSGGFYLVKRTSPVLAVSKVMGSPGYIFMIIRGVPGQDAKHPPPLRLDSQSPCLALATQWTPHSFNVNSQTTGSI